jgi:hypothetical protein
MVTKENWNEGNVVGMNERISEPVGDICKGYKIRARCGIK